MIAKGVKITIREISEILTETLEKNGCQTQMALL